MVVVGATAIYLYIIVLEKAVSEGDTIQPTMVRP